MFTKKWVKFMSFFVLALSLVGFAGATPEFLGRFLHQLPREAEENGQENTVENRMQNKAINLGAPRCGSGPNWCLEGPPPSPIVISGPLPQAKPLPSPPSPSLVLKDVDQEPLNDPFLDGLFSRRFSRGKIAH